MRRFLQPGVSKIIFFALFLLIAVGGHLQSEGFSDGAGQHVFLPGFPFWEAWMVLLAPYALIAALFRRLGIDIAAFRGAAILFWGAQLIYFYVLACVLVSIVAALRRKREVAA